MSAAAATEEVDNFLKNNNNVITQLLRSGNSTYLGDLGGDLRDFLEVGLS